MVNPLVIENSVVVSCVKEFSGALVVPEGVVEIGQYAFKGCNKITSIIIPDGVRVIGNSAFSGCSSLESLEVPDSVCEIRGLIFGLFKEVHIKKTCLQFQDIFQTTT